MKIIHFKIIINIVILKLSFKKPGIFPDIFKPSFFETRVTNRYLYAQYRFAYTYFTKNKL